MGMGMVSPKFVEAQHEQLWFADRFDEQSKTNSFTSPRSGHLSAQQFRGGRLKVSHADFRIAPWNVEGLTESKVFPKLQSCNGICGGMRSISCVCRKRTKNIQACELQMGTVCLPCSGADVL